MLNAVDGIMIARGDLGVEVPIERIAIIQKDLMREANEDAGQIIVPSGGNTESGPGLLEWATITMMVAESRPTSQRR